jgi:hypothetical protein
MQTGSGVAIDQANPAVAVTADGEGKPVKYALSPEDIRLLAFEAARRGDRAHAARLAEVLGEDPPKVGFFEKLPTRGEIFIAAGVVAVAGVGAYIGVRMVQRRAAMKSVGGKVVKMVPPAPTLAAGSR